MIQVHLLIIKIIFESYNGNSLIMIILKMVGNISLVLVYLYLAQIQASV